MLDINEIENRLWYGTVSQVDSICTRLKISKTGNKIDKINKILDFYRKDNIIEDTYNSLNEYELELTNSLVNQKYNPTSKSINEIKNKYKDKYLSIDKFYIFFIYDEVPDTIKAILEKLVPPMEIKFESIKDIDIDKEYASIIGYENRIDIFDEFIRYINTNKVKITEKNRFITKKDVIKFHSIANFSEIFRTSKMNFENIKNMNDTIISYGIVKLLDSCHILDINKEYVKKSTYYDDYIKMNKLEKQKFLFNQYLKSSTVFLNEIDRIMTAKIKTKMFPELKSSREFIVDMLKLLPTDNSFIKDDEFKEKIRMKDYNFLRCNTNYTLASHINKYVNTGYEEASFEEFENGFIDICLMNFLSIIGVVDVILEEYKNYYLFESYLKVKYIRLTNLGMILLGLKEEEKEEIIDKKFLLNDNGEIIIPKSDKSMEYELFFEKFCDNEEKDNNKIFKLDFTSIIKANDLNINIFKIIEYIKEYASSYSNKYMDLLYEYSFIYNEVKIKKIYVLEYSDKVKEKIEQDKKIAKLLKNSNNIISIEEKDIKNIKKEIENLELICNVYDEE